MEPSEFSFDIEAYKKQAEIEDKYIVNRFRERRKKINEDYPAHIKRKYFKRYHVATNQRLIDDYFVDQPIYDDVLFRRRSDAETCLPLDRIVNDLSNIDNYFTQRVDAANKQGISPLAKCTTAMRMLAYGVAADAVDEYIKIGGTTALECLRGFCNGIIQLYEPVYLRAPTLQRILHVSEQRGFPGMIGSIDCMHLEWKNFPTAWECQFTRGDKGTTAVIFEAVASHDLWIWHAFFGCRATLNDINVLDRSTVFDDVEQGNTLRVNFFVNQRPYNMAYYLADDIYPIRLSSNLLNFLRVNQTSYLHNIKRDVGRKSNVHLECCRLDSKSFAN